MLSASRKVVRLTLDHLDALPDPCASCLFWQLDPVRRQRVEDPRAEKEAWLSHLLREWGSCGRVVLVDDRPVGHLIYAPQAFLPGSAGIATAPVSPDAVLLASAYVDPAHAAGGLGRMLVQGMARDLISRGGIRAVEAFGDARPQRLPRPGGAMGCLLPVDFLGGVGFKTHRPHALTPRMRMDLRSALTWRDEVEAALERLVGAVRPASKAAPAPVPDARAAQRPTPRPTRRTTRPPTR
ncbi:GNAT family N-acetyltransferase [Nocardioides ferulae]|uniref:GNAT family N-acetyltransferase n=1 Tax=Nocardioides ferulae TaxID=2340821 RepID=UPI000EB05F97|nr:GNAT family N-acetyltransferase [Nocardioides ferulae]